MRKMIMVILSLVVAMSVPLIAGAQINSAANGGWTEGTSWVGGVVPTSADDVFIAAGDTISVDDQNAECRSISFGGDDAQIDINPNSMLTVYGDFAIFSETHTAFAAGWSGTNAFIKFAGSAIQTLSGFRTTGGSTSLRDVIVDKDGGKLTTQGNGMRLGIQNSLEIVNGLFELAPGDDLEGRWASSGNYRNAELPNVTIHENGEWYFADGSGVHHVRSYYSSSTPDTYYPLGTVTIYGKATFRDGSTNKISFAAIDVEAGGKLITSLGMGGQEFNCGPLLIKDGGELENYTTSDIYNPASTVTLDAGGLFDTKASATIFPGSFVDNGTIRYSRNGSTDQTIVDRDYNNLEISLDTDNAKIWTLSAARSVMDTLVVNGDGNLVVNADTPQILTVNNLLYLTSGSLDNSDPEIDLTMADGSLIQRATGVMTTAPTFAGMIDLRYTSTVAQVATGPEVPSASGVLDDFRLSGTEGVLMTSNLTVNGAMSIERSDLITGAFNVTLAAGATLDESDDATILGTAMTTRTAVQSVNETFGGLGLEILAAGAAPGATTVTRVTGTAQMVNGSPGILRSFQVSPANNAGLDATVVFHFDNSEVNGLNELALRIYSDTGGGWAESITDVEGAANTLTGNGFDSFADLTAAQGDVTDVAEDMIPVRTEIASIYPNPFNPMTKVELTLEKAGPVQVAIFNVRGQKVRTLENGVLESGSHELTWRGLDDGGRAVPSGVYFCRLMTDEKVVTQKMLLAR